MVAAIEAPAREAVQQRYEGALEAFVARVRQDGHILAAVLFGSLAYDEVWERSDIDLWLIARDDSTSQWRTPG
jgi:predicted nucleotidyltransferase